MNDKCLICECLKVSFLTGYRFWVGNHLPLEFWKHPLPLLPLKSPKPFCALILCVKAVFSSLQHCKIFPLLQMVTTMCHFKIELFSLIVLGALQSLSHLLLSSEEFFFTYVINSFLLCLLIEWLWNFSDVSLLNDYYLNIGSPSLILLFPFFLSHFPPLCHFLYFLEHFLRSFFFIFLSIPRLSFSFLPSSYLLYPRSPFVLEYLILIASCSYFTGAVLCIPENSKVFFSDTLSSRSQWFHLLCVTSIFVFHVQRFVLGVPFGLLVPESGVLKSVLESQCVHSTTSFPRSWFVSTCFYCYHPTKSFLKFNIYSVFPFFFH